MGLFDDKEDIYVASSIYNTAGDYSDRTDYMKYLVITNTLTDTPYTLGEAIVRGTLKGPGIGYRQFFRWGKNNYPAGMPSGGVYGKTTLALEDVDAAIVPPDGWTTMTQTAETGYGDYEYWAEQWVAKNHPAQLMTQWTASYDTGPVITITFENGDMHYISGDDMEVPFDTDQQYIYARYSFYLEVIGAEYIHSLGSLTGPIGTEGEIPLTGFDYEDELVENAVPHEITQHVHQLVTWDDGTPSQETENTSVVGSMTYTRTTKNYRQPGRLVRDTTNVDPTAVAEEFIRRPIWNEPGVGELVTIDTVVDEPTPGVFRTTVTTTTTQNYTGSTDFFYRDDTWFVPIGYMEPVQLFIYAEDSGNPTLDAHMGSGTVMDGYFPFIPLKRKSKFINDFGSVEDGDYNADDEAFWKKTRTCYKRATGGAKLEKIIDNLADNDNIDDVDFAYMHYGVPFNTLTNEGRRYIFEYFETIRQYEGNTKFDFLAYIANSTANASNNAAATQFARMANSLRFNKNKIRLKCNHSKTNHIDFRIHWNFISRTNHNGVYEHTTSIGGSQQTEVLKRGDVRIIQGETYVEQNPVVGVVNDINTVVTVNSLEHQSIYIIHQTTNDTYSVIEVNGLEHRNVVYKGEKVKIKAKGALNDGDDSGLLIPLHYSTLKSMPIPDANQLCLESQIIVLNSYEVVTQPWYTKAWFRLFVVIAIVVVTVLLNPAAAAAAGGLLGGNAAIGTALGLSGVSATIAGAVANALASMLLMEIISRVAVEILGEKWGMIVAAIAGIVLGSLQGSMMGGDLSINWSSMMRADNLLKLTNAVIQGYTAHVVGVTEGIYEDIEDLVEKEKRETREIQRKSIETLGLPSGFDPMALTATSMNTFHVEKVDSFMKRTLMTGSEIAELDHLMITDYVAKQLELELK